MANEFLSQDEVDALLKGVGDEPATAAAAEASGGLRPYRFGTQDRIVRAGMPALDIIHDRFARLLRVGIFNFMRRSPEVSIAPPRIVKYSDFIAGLAVPTSLNLATAKPLRGLSLFVIEPTLIFLIIDNLFGGDGRFHARVDGREFTQTEQRIVDRLLQVVFQEYQKAWARVYPLRFEHVRSEMHPQFAAIATPAEIVVASSFNVEFGGQGGAFHICIPYAALEPVRDLVHGAADGARAEPEQRWAQTLRKQVQLADVEIVANLATTTVKLGDLMKMRVGDVLPIGLPGTVEARVDGVPVMECGYGELNGRLALRVERLVRPEIETKQGADRV